MDHAIDAINLAKQFNISDVHKRAYYELLRSFGFKQTGADPVVSLSCEQLHLLLQTREKLCEAWVSAITFPKRWVECASKMRCPRPAQRRQSWSKLVHESGLARKWALDPIGGLSALRKANWKAEKMCDECFGKRRSEWADKKKEIWGKLDEWLGLNGNQQVSIPVAHLGRIIYLY